MGSTVFMNGSRTLLDSEDPDWSLVTKPSVYIAFPFPVDPTCLAWR